jgi:hypothetical protein
MAGYAQVNNGRVPGLDATTAPPFSMYTDAGGSAGALGLDTLRHILSASPLARLFFGSDNVAALHHGIRYGVYRASGGRYVIGRQSDIELGLIMRATYLEYAHNGDGPPPTLIEQVRTLNRRVLDFCVPRVTREVEMNREYVRQLGTLPEPIPYGPLSTAKGSRQLVGPSHLF